MERGKPHEQVTQIMVGALHAGNELSMGADICLEIDDYHRFWFLDQMTYGTWLIETYNYRKGRGSKCSLPFLFWKMESNNERI